MTTMAAHRAKQRYTRFGTCVVALVGIAETAATGGILDTSRQLLHEQRHRLAQEPDLIRSNAARIQVEVNEGAVWAFQPQGGPGGPVDDSVGVAAGFDAGKDLVSVLTNGCIQSSTTVGNIARLHSKAQ